VIKKICLEAWAEDASLVDIDREALKREQEGVLQAIFRGNEGTFGKGRYPNDRRSGALMTLRPGPSTAIALGTVVLEVLCNQEEVKNLLPDLHFEKEPY